MFGKESSFLRRCCTARVVDAGPASVPLVTSPYSDPPSDCQLGWAWVQPGLPESESRELGDHRLVLRRTGNEPVTASAS
jgi:hypothetical protein